MAQKMFKLEYYVPKSHLEATKQAVFAAGGGRIGNYDCCAFQTEGTGQFRPLAASNPYIGTQGRIEKVKEYKVEMVCAAEHVEAAVAALKQSHPYETPAYCFFETTS